MPIIKTIQERAARPVKAAAPTAAARATAQLGQQVLRVDQQIQSANRSRRVNEASTAMTKAMMDHEVELEKVPREFETHNTTHTTFLKDLRDGFVSNSEDQEERDAVTANFDRVALHSSNRVRQRARRLNINAGQAALEDMSEVLSVNYAELGNDADRELLLDGYNAAIDQAVTDGILHDTQGTKAKQAFVQQSEKLRASRDITVDPQAALAAIKGNAYEITEQDKQVAIGQATRAIAADQTAKEKAGAQAQQKVWTDLHDAIDQGLAGKADIEKARAQNIPGTSKNLLSEQGTRALLTKLRLKQKADKKKSGWRKIYQDSITTGRALDHKTKDHREAANMAFLEFAGELPDMIPDDANKKIVDEVIRPTKIMPEELMKQMRITAKDAHLPTVEQYSKLYSTIRRDVGTSPALVSMPPADEAFWAAVTNLRDAGALNNESLSLAKHNAYELTEDDRVAIRAEYKRKKYVSTNREIFNNDIIPEFDELDTSSISALADSAWSKIWDDAPKAPPGMVADYQNMVKQYFHLTNDIEESRQLAKEAVMRAWITEEIEE